MPEFRQHLSLARQRRSRLQPRFPPSSDVDIFVVVDPVPPMKLGKFRYQNQLLEVSYLAPAQLQEPDQILAGEMAGSFAQAIILFDPTDNLARLQSMVRRQYAAKQWVEARCAAVHERILTMLAGLAESAPLPAQVNSCLFGASLMTYVLLLAGLQLPTVRRRYLAARQLLADYQQLPFYDKLLKAAGIDQISKAQVEQFLLSTTAVFDQSKDLVKTPYRFASDISDAARPIAIDGSRALIEQGYHREAIFYLLATYSRCQHILANDAPPAIQASYSKVFRQLLAELDLATFAARQTRATQVRTFLPQVRQMAQRLIKLNPHLHA